jgi:hypothetical protein
MSEEKKEPTLAELRQNGGATPEKGGFSKESWCALVFFLSAVGCLISAILLANYLNQLPQYQSACDNVSALASGSDLPASCVTYQSYLKGKNLTMVLSIIFFIVGMGAAGLAIYFHVQAKKKKPSAH